MKDVEAILDAHYLGRDIQLAASAILKLKAHLCFTLAMLPVTKLDQLREVHSLTKPSSSSFAPWRLQI
ncbi:MAG TPA: hypothetical protein VHB49_25675 [Bradyrhizobium sp.]|nr:hypothetical protein [Bradyrhizobium sp.]